MKSISARVTRGLNIGGILLIVLYQTPLITTDIVEVISEAQQNF